MPFASRRLGLACAAVAFAAVSVGVAVARPAHEPSSAGSETPLLRSIHAGTARRSPAPPARHAATIPGVPRWGMNGDDVLQASTDAEREALLADMKAAGAGLIRLDVTWSYIQPSRGSWNWWYYDKVMNEIEDAGLEAIMLLDYGNVAYESTTNQAPPPNVADFASFAASVAQRYAPLGLHIFEVWNEPNMGANWNGHANPAAYAALLKASSVAIKQVDPAAIIVSGGIAPTTTAGGNISQQAFLTGMLAAGAGQYVDAVGYHPYVGSGWDELPTMRQIVVDHGLASKQIWATETGWSTYGVSDQTQADRVTNLMNQWKTFSWAGPLSWYAHVDRAPVTQGSFYDHFGLVRTDGTHKLSWAAYQTQAMATSPLQTR